jgi:hypothetical protein
MAMRKLLLPVFAAMTLVLGLSAAVQAANQPTSGNAATVTKATLPSSIFDGTTLFPATCDETQVIDNNQRKETFECTFDAGAPEMFVCDSSFGCLWFSDFDGAEATSTHFVITASGRLVGWATYS